MTRHTIIARALGTVVVGLWLFVGCGSGALAQTDRPEPSTTAVTTTSRDSGGSGSGSGSKGFDHWGLLGLLGLLGLARRRKGHRPASSGKGRPEPRIAFNDTALAKLRAADAVPRPAVDQDEQPWSETVDPWGTRKD